MIITIRVLFIIISALLSFFYFSDNSLQIALLAGLISGGASFGLLIAIEYISHTVSTRMIVAAMIGLITGLILSYLIVMAFSYLPLPLTSTQNDAAKAIIFHIISFSVMLFFVINNEDMIILNKILPHKIDEGKNTDTSYKILDTSVIIDGRIADISKAGFLEGNLLIPGFVLFRIISEKMNIKKKQKIVAAWFQPPNDAKGVPLNPAEVGALIDSTMDNRDVVALIIWLAQKGYLKITQKGTDDISLTKIKDLEIGESIGDKEIKLFSGIPIFIV